MYVDSNFPLEQNLLVTKHMLILFHVGIFLISWYMSTGERWSPHCFLLVFCRRCWYKLYVAMERTQFKTISECSTLLNTGTKPNEIVLHCAIHTSVVLLSRVLLHSVLHQ